MITLVESVGKEIFVGGGDLDSYTPAPIFIARTLVDFEKKVHQIPIDASEELRAVHGYLTSAISIPKDIPENTEIFLILPNANEEQDNFITEISSLYLLEKVIEAMVNLDQIDEGETEEIIDYVTNVEKQEIEDIFILYGYSLEMTHHIPKSNYKVLDFKSKSKSLRQVVEGQV